MTANMDRYFVQRDRWRWRIYRRYDNFYILPAITLRFWRRSTAELVAKRLNGAFQDGHWLAAASQLTPRG